MATKTTTKAPARNTARKAAATRRQLTNSGPTARRVNGATKVTDTQGNETTVPTGGPTLPDATYMDLDQDELDPFEAVTITPTGGKITRKPITRHVQKLTEWPFDHQVDMTVFTKTKGLRRYVRDDAGEVVRDQDGNPKVELYDLKDRDGNPVDDKRTWMSNFKSAKDLVPDPDSFDGQPGVSLKIEDEDIFNNRTILHIVKRHRRPFTEEEMANRAAGQRKAARTRAAKARANGNGGPTNSDAKPAGATKAAR